MQYNADVAGFPDLDERVFHAPRYRLKLLRTPWPAGSKYSHLACLGRWTTYDREALLACRGRVPEDFWLEGLVDDRDIRCDAWVEENWALASWWLIVDLARCGEQSRVRQPNLLELADRMLKIRKHTQGHKPELGELSCHLADHEVLSRADAIEVAELMRCFDVYADYWTNNVNNGRKRLKRGAPCRFDENLPN